jgi:TPR repeat protein
MLKSDLKKYDEPTKPDLSTRLKAPIRNISETRTTDRSPENPTKPKATKFFHRDLPKDASETVRNRFKKAMSGDPVAQFLLGQNYEIGDGVEDHYTEAARWYKESAQQGNPDAQLKLALLSKSGLGVDRDLTLAKNYAQSALNSGHHFSEAERRQLDELLSLKTESSPDVIDPSNSELK